MRFVGIGGLAPGADLDPFIERTGTGGFTHLDDEEGELWQRFGTGGRSTFMFVDDDGTFELTSYGVAGEDELIRQAERLIGS